ncbi:cytochrome P450 71A9-like [Amborella trichopoda]|nr:cytochrome P450 71A9-like [Amborella trichopoda]|eukprot:XP_020521009.1 cytochrome P450 71A9-like [Amborella trichopoda]
MHLKLGRVPTLVVSSPKMAELVMKTYDHAFCSRSILVATNYLTYGSTNVAFAPYGSYWRHVRKICILELLSSKRVQSFRFVRKEEVGRLVDSIFVSSKAKAPVNLTEAFLSLSNNVVCRVALGKSYWEEEPELREIFESSKSLIGGFFVGDFFPSLEWVKYLTGFQRRLEKSFRHRDSFLEKVIAEHLLPTHGKEDEEEEEEKDLVDVLLQLQKEGTLISPSLPITSKVLLWICLQLGQIPLQQH